MKNCCEKWKRIHIHMNVYGDFIFAKCCPECGGRLDGKIEGIMEVRKCPKCNTEMLGERIREVLIPIEPKEGTIYGINTDYMKQEPKSEWCSCEKPKILENDPYNKGMCYSCYKPIKPKKIEKLDTKEWWDNGSLVNLCAHKINEVLDKINKEV